MRRYQLSNDHPDQIAKPIILEIDRDGFAERTGWAGKDDGLLVRDLDGDGKITSGREVFGQYSQTTLGREVETGYEALAMDDVGCFMSGSLFAPEIIAVCAQHARPTGRFYSRPKVVANDAAWELTA